MPRALKLQISGNSGVDYNLVVTRNASFDVEGNHSRKAVAKLRLKSVRRAASDMLWIKYAVRKTGGLR